MHPGLRRLVGAAAAVEDVGSLLAEALPALQRTWGVTTVAVLGGDGDPSGERTLVVEHAGDGVPDGVLAGLPVGACERLSEPGSIGGHEVEVHPAGRLDLLLVRGTGSDGVAQAGGDHAVVIDLVRAGLARLEASRELRSLRQRVEEAQRLVGMGDWDWHIALDRVRWSDEVFRIFGHEPGAVTPTYDAFLAAVHPDDRALVQAAHARLLETGEPCSFVGRVVRPDGDVRHVSSRAELVTRADGTPTRMRGTSLDVTDLVTTERTLEQSASRLKAMVEASTQAVLLVDAGGRVVEANTRAQRLLGEGVAGRSCHEVLASTSTALGVVATDLRGRSVRVDVRTAVLQDDPTSDHGGLEAVFLEPSAPREEREQLAARLLEARLRRRQALEINDNVVQGLATASYALEAGRATEAEAHLRHTLAAARSMMDDLLEPLAGEDLSPGDLVRREPSCPSPRRPAAGPVATGPAPDRGAVGGTRRVLLVDDSADLRALARHFLDRVDGLEVVGEAEDGLVGVERARELQPDLVVLDLSMPRMDGLQALPRIKAVAPAARVVVFSGFEESALAERALAAGADAYASKGTSMRELVEVVTSTLGRTGPGELAPGR